MLAFLNSQAIEGFPLVQGKWLECSSGLSCSQSPSTILLVVLQAGQATMCGNSHVPCFYLWTHQLLLPPILFN